MSLTLNIPAWSSHVRLRRESCGSGSWGRRESSRDCRALISSAAGSVYGGMRLQSSQFYEYVHTVVHAYFCRTDNSIKLEFVGIKRRRVIISKKSSRTKKHILFLCNISSTFVRHRFLAHWNGRGSSEYLM
jgi:hypothetical protein